MYKESLSRLAGTILLLFYTVMMRVELSVASYILRACSKTHRNPLTHLVKNNRMVTLCSLYDVMLGVFYFSQIIQFVY